MLKKWLDAGKCLVGAHQGEWVSLRADSCELVQTCLACGQESRRVEHLWLAWSGVPDDPCAETRRCDRCGETERREEHQPGDWQYVADGECLQMQRCERCRREYEETRVEHDWGVWTYSEPHRAPIRHCVRCMAGITYLGADFEPSASAQVSVTAAAPVAAAPAPAEAAASELTAAAAPAAAPAAADPSMAMFALIRAEYEAQVARGQIAPSRQPRYAAMLDELERIVSTPAPDLVTLQVKSRRVQEMLAGFSSALMDPSRPEPVAAPVEGSRAALLLAQLQTLHAYVMAEVGDNQLTGDSGTALAHLIDALHRCRDALAAPMSDADLTKFEVESLRPLVLAIREFSLREHLALADPVWPSPVVVQHPGAVFYAGGDEVLHLVRHACGARGLRVLVPQRHREPASLRWNQLREASIATFDFTAWERAQSLDAAVPVASVAYEFGIALALGRPVVIVSDAGRGLPFDLDIDPVPVEHDDGDASRVADAIDHTLYGLQRGHAGSSVSDTLAVMRARYGDSADMRVRVSIASMEDDLAHDPVKARLVASSILGYLGADGPQLLWPSWPVASPDPQSRSCFHVTAFGPPWARQTRDIVRTACPSDVTYVRGDQALDPDIIRSIWDEICGASHIVVDLTGLNANVLVELGMAHTLGRNVLLISQDPNHYVRALTKHRIHHYALDTEADVEALREHVAAFVTR